MKLKKWLIGIGIGVGILFLAFKFIAWPMMKEETKKISPQKVVSYSQNGYDITVAYSSPFKNGRKIFGELVPFDKVWRTGANEPTTLTTTNTIIIKDKELPAGTYSLWTIPGEKNWQIIVNKEVPEWGVTLISGGKETTRNSENDIIKVSVPVNHLSTIQESLDISFQKEHQLYLSLAWDATQIKVPINK